MARILIVEDEFVIRTSLKKLLEKNGHLTELADSVDAAEKFTFSDFDLILSDLRLPGRQGTDLIALAGDTPVLIMTSYASVRSAVDSMQAGAFDYIAKPFDHDDLLSTVANCLSQSKDTKADASLSKGSTKKAKSVETPLQGFDGIIGKSPAMQPVFEAIRRVSQTDTTVLVNGQTGTGKELVARAIHGQSPRSEKPLISVNCAAIPETLIESELFGYEKGAFTGANTSRGGLIEAAEGGTLFLDEIGELPLMAQARLLRFLQEGEIRAVGSLETKKVNVRLVAATHRDLKLMADEGDFREDLYFRIAVFPIKLPPLAERGEDILAIAESLLSEFETKAPYDDLHFSPKAVQAISTYSWPGNIRELRNAVERAVILATSSEILYQDLGLDIEPINVSKIRSSKKAQDKKASLVEETEESSEDVSLEDYFQRFVMEHQHTMSETELAKKLGISRKCLWERRQRFDIPRTKAPSSKAKSTK